MADILSADKSVLDYADGLKRFSNVAMLYQKHLKKFPADQTCNQLVEAMNQGDFEEAFRQAHTLKGIAGNLSLAGLYQICIPFVEALRGGADIEKAKELLPELEVAYHRAVDEITSLEF